MARAALGFAWLVLAIEVVVAVVGGVERATPGALLVVALPLALAVEILVVVAVATLLGVVVPSFRRLAPVPRLLWPPTTRYTQKRNYAMF